MTTRIRALIVDDESLARKGIRSLLAKEDDFYIVGECENGADAVRRIREDAPDIVFLDVQMPALDGFGVIEAIGADKMPVTIFVTAYDEYALKAFDSNALDYLLKPFDRQRFARAVTRARGHVRLRTNKNSGGAADEQLLSLLRQLNAREQYVDRLLVKSGPRVVFLKVREIDWIEAAGNYVRLHTASDSHLLHETMSHVEDETE